MTRMTRPTKRSRAAALVASVSLLVPGLAAPVAAQTAEDVLAACTAEFGAEGDALANCIAERAPAAAAPTDDAGVAAQAEAEAAAEADRQAEAQAAADAEAQAQAEAQAVAEAEAQATAEQEAQAAAQAEAEAQAQAAEQAAAEAEAEAAVEREAQLAAEAEAEAEEQAAAEAEAAADSEAAAAEQPVAPAPEAPGAGAEAPAAEGTAEAEAPVETEAPVLETASPLAPTANDSAIADEIAARPEPELSEEQETARQQAESALGALLGGTGGAAAAAAATEEEPGAAEVEEAVVSEDDVRTSDQDFETRAVVTEDAPRFDRNDKLLLGALGALAVGAVLVNQNNRSRVVSNSGDRVVVQGEDGNLRVLKDDDVLLRQAGSNVRTERFDDGSTRQTVLREDGSRVVTIRDASLRVLRRELITEGGERFMLIDDTADVEPVDLATLPAPIVSTRATRADDPLAAALRQQEQLDRRFSLAQVRNIAEVRALAPAFNVDSVTFASGSAAIAPEQAANLRGMANEVLALIRSNPREVFLVEGHTDAVGDAAFNLALSDRRAESLALALNEYFGVPVENMVVQGYGESFLKVQTQADEQANRRATVRQITGLLQTAAAN